MSGARASGAMNVAGRDPGDSDSQAISIPDSEIGRTEVQPAQSVAWQSLAAGAVGQQSGSPDVVAITPHGIPVSEDRAATGNATARVSASRMVRAFRIG